MKLGKPAKILIGLGTVWLVLYPFLFFAVWLAMVMGMGFMSSYAEENSPFGMAPFGLFFAIFPLHCLTILLQLVLEAFYLIHVIKNTTANETIRIILGVGAFFMPFIAMPVYYVLYIWLDQPPAWALAQKTEQAVV